MNYWQICAQCTHLDEDDALKFFLCGVQHYCWRSASYVSATSYACDDFSIDLFRSDEAIDELKEEERKGEIRNSNKYVYESVESYSRRAFEEDLRILREEALRNKNNSNNNNNTRGSHKKKVKRR